jgi:hypothetical protein
MHVSSEPPRLDVFIFTPIFPGFTPRGQPPETSQLVA